jgi:hypothetical protein
MAKTTLKLGQIETLYFTLHEKHFGVIIHLVMYQVSPFKPLRIQCITQVYSKTPAKAKSEKDPRG